VYVCSIISSVNYRTVVVTCYWLGPEFLFVLLLITLYLRLMPYVIPNHT